MKLKIIADGSPRGTRVINAHTGEELDNIVKVEWSHEALGVPIIWLTLNNVEIDAIGEMIDNESI